MEVRAAVVVLLLINTACAQEADEQACSREDASIRCDQIEEPVIDCHPEPDPTEAFCQSRGCQWQGKRDDSGAPWCTFPTNHGYRLVDEPIVEANGYRFKLRRTSSSTLFGSDVDHVELLVEFQSVSRLRLKFYDPNAQRYEVPLPTYASKQSHSVDKRLFDFKWTATESRFGIQIIRRSDGTVVFDTNLPGFVFSDQFLQISTKLSSPNVYGFGEHNHATLRHDMNWRRWAMFSKDILVQHDHNLYGVQPFYINLEDSGAANGVFLKNSNGMEVALQPNPHPAITFRAIGGILDFYIFLGPSPSEVVQQYTEAVGRPKMPPYWSLGFMLCRWGYNSSAILRQVIERNGNAGIPMDAQIIDIDYMFEELDFTYDRTTFEGLPDIVQDLHNNGQKLIAMVDPGIGRDEEKLQRSRKNSPGYQVYEDGLERGVYIRNPTGDDPLVGKVWPGLTVFPDFTNPETENWWRKWIHYLYKDENIKFDGLWIDMNEPASFIRGSLAGCEENHWNNPPFLPGLMDKNDETRQILFKTICMDSMQDWGRHYDVHSLYAHSEAMQTFGALRKLFPKKRPMLLTRSNYAGTSKYAIHWLGDNFATWEHLRESIIGILEYSMFGFPIVGPDICGFWGETTEELCMRWMELGAFYPLSRNHNAMQFSHQDPAVFGEKMISVSKNVLLTRYKLLPYLYTLVHFAHTEGRMVARPLFHEFPDDKQTWDIDRQFLWGPALLISPALEQAQRDVRAYFSKGNWFDYYTGKETSRGSHGKYLNLPTELEHINLHIRGGYVIPWQEPTTTTTYSRRNPIGLIVALNESREAEGDLYWDDGETFETYETGEYLQLHFVVKTEKLVVEVVHNGYRGADSLIIDTINIFGLHIPPSKVFVDGGPQSRASTHIHSDSTSLTDLRLALTKPHVVEWLSY